jgi:hypothetical protein
MKRRAASGMTANQVCDVLRSKHFMGEAYAFLREVRNGTGYSKQDRYADALAVSCWPSRGIWVAGVEVKVARYDWLRELKQPEKSVEIQKFCSYWWIAAPEGVVQTGELPETWGLIEVTEKTRTVVKEAPRLTPEPFSPSFIASVLRNYGGTAEALLRAEYLRGKNEALEGADDPDVENLKNVIAQERTSKGYFTKQLDDLKAKVRAFEEKTGLNIEHEWYQKHGPIVALARRLVELDVGQIESRLRRAADEVADVRKTVGTVEAAE